MKVLKINKSSFVESGNRFDASYHLSDGPITKIKLSRSPYQLTTLSEESEKIFSGNIFKRTFVSNKDKGFDYITGSDMVKSNIDSGKYISKKYTKKTNDLRIHKDWILITCSGTVGNTVYTNDIFEGRIGTHDLIRIIPNDKNVKRGFIYAYLSSKYGYGLLTQSSYGGVVKHIEPHHIENLPIPILPESKQQEIHNLITESAKLRAEANKLLNESQNKIVEKINFSMYRLDYLNKRVKLSAIKSSHHKRFESHFYNSKGSDFKDYILNTNHILLKEISEKIFRPGIFKRNYVQNGTDFLGGSDITKSIPDSDKKLSVHNTPNFKSLILKEDWILVTCGGTIGTTVLVNEYLSKKLASQHILRIIPKDIKVGYLFAFLSSEIGLKVIQSYTYGSVIPQIEPHHLELVPIPIFENTFMDDIHLNIMEYKYKINEAIIKENQAIDLIEKEIDGWQ